MFYVFGAAALGALLHTTANGSKAASSVQAGLERWTDKLSDSSKVSIMQNNYGASDAAVQKFREACPEKAEELFPTDQSKVVASNFTEQGFLVCHLQHVFYNLFEFVQLICQLHTQVYAKQLHTKLMQSCLFLSIFHLCSTGVVTATIYFYS